MKDRNICPSCARDFNKQPLSRMEEILLRQIFGYKGENGETAVLPDQAISDISYLMARMERVHEGMMRAVRYACQGDSQAMVEQMMFATSDPDPASMTPDAGAEHLQEDQEMGYGEHWLYAIKDRIGFHIAPASQAEMGDVWQDLFRRAYALENRVAELESGAGVEPLQEAR